MTRRWALVLLLVLVSTLAAPATAAPVAAAPGTWAAVSCVAPACLAVGVSGSVAGTADGTTWTLRTSVPNAERLYDVQCVTTEQCYAAGDDSRDIGVIWLTTDAGATWALTPATVGGGVFFAISCPSQSTCVATGNQGAVSTTTDSGRHWHSQIVSGASLILDVDCVTTAVCEAVGYSGANGVTGIALRSVDGGRHWRVTPFHTTFPEPAGIDCTSLLRCVAVGSDRINGRKQLTRVFITTDGGVSWQRQPTPAGYILAAGVSCPSALACYLASLGPTGILATTDGGTAWQPQGPTGVFLRGVICASASTCVAVGEQEGNDKGAIFTTTNAGRVWHRSVVAT